MYASEKAFILKFIACLKKLGVNEIPCDNVSFDKGAENMQQYFQRNRDQLGRYANELAMLFLKNPLGGTFSELKEGIEHQNGRLMAFENPHYIHATIKLDECGADYILNQINIDLSNDQIYQFSKAFCVGADILLWTDGDSI